MPLQHEIGQVRSVVSIYTATASQYAQSGLDKWIEMETSVSSAVSSVKHPKEHLIPSAFYVLGAGLAGSLLAKSSNGGLVRRVWMPAVGIVSGLFYFFPKTSGNMANGVYDAPMREKHLAVLKDGVNSVLDAPGKATSSISSYFHDLTKKDSE